MIYENKIKSINYVIGTYVYNYTVNQSFGGGVCESIEFTETANGTPYINIKTDVNNLSIMNVPFELAFY